MESYQDTVGSPGTVPPDMLVKMLEAEYALPRPVDCAFQRRGVNEHYLVTAGGRRFMLRIHAPDKYWILSPSDLCWELNLLTYLHARNAPVAYPIRRLDGDTLTALQAPAGIRYAALFSYAEGRVTRAVTEEQSRTFGMEVARLHLASNDFGVSHARYHLDLYMLLDRPMEPIKQHVPETRPADARFLERIVDELKEEVRRCGIGGDGYGVIHADLRERNIQVTDDGQITFFDFDHSGYGWRAYDLAVFLAGKHDAVRVACLEGYRSVRALSHGELIALPTFMKIRWIWRVGDMLPTAHPRPDVWVPVGYWERCIGRLQLLFDAPVGGELTA